MSCAWGIFFNESLLEFLLKNFKIIYIRLEVFACVESEDNLFQKSVLCIHHVDPGG